MSDAVEMRDPFNTATAMLVRALQKRQELVEDLQPKIPAIMDGLVDSALGVWKEREVTNKKGEIVGVKLYQREPDVKAIKELLRMSGLEPEELSKILLDMNRVRAIEADVESGFAKAKVKNLDSQSLLNEENAKAFAASFVLEEDVQSAALSVASACIGFIQTIPVEVMQQNCKDSASYQAWQAKIAEVVWEAYGEKVGVSDNPAIDAEFTEDEDDDSEEEEE
jgi:hypothetical protein